MYSSILYIFFGLFVFANGALMEECSRENKFILDMGNELAERYLQNAVEVLGYVDGKTFTDLRYTRWFGTFNSDRHSILMNHFNAMVKVPPSNYTYICNNDCTFLDNKSGYVMPFDFGKIHLCPQFWNSHFNGTDSWPMAIIELASQFEVHGGANMYTSGEENCQELAKGNPDLAIVNASNIAYFVTNDPFD